MYRSSTIPGHSPVPPTFKPPNTAHPPPNIPPGYGTDLYPAENLDPLNHPALQMEEISRNRKSNEFSSITKVPNYRNLRIKNRDDKYYCNICSEYPSPMVPRGKIIRHRHNSSKIKRMYWNVHLDNKSRLRMGKAAVKYFMVLYDIIKCSASSKVKGLETEKRKAEQAFSYSKKCKYSF